LRFIQFVGLFCACLARSHKSDLGLSENSQGLRQWSWLLALCPISVASVFFSHALTVAAMMAITDLDRFKAAWRFI
jgi:hypothetical protein